MKYQMHDVAIPKEQREDINTKILYMLSNSQVDYNGFTPEEIGSFFSGAGGLHGLKQEDYYNYHQFSAAKKEKEKGQFFTPYKLTDFIMKLLSPSDSDIIMDLTCGKGSFFNSCPVEGNVYGCEIDPAAIKVAKYLYPDANLHECDIRSFKPDIMADLIVGNPPFNLNWKVNYDGESAAVGMLSQLYYCVKAAELLKPLGLLAIVVPESFLKNDFFELSRFNLVESYFKILFAFDLPDDAFNTYGINFKTKLIIMQRRSGTVNVDNQGNRPGQSCQAADSLPKMKAVTAVLDLDEATAWYLHNMHIRPLVEIKNKNKSALYLEQVKNASLSKSFENTLKKLMYDINRHGKISEKSKRMCESYVHQFLSQKKPADMDYESWQRAKITEKKVIAYLKRALRSVNKQVESDTERMVKKGDTFYVKGYSHKARANLKKQNYRVGFISQHVYANMPEPQVHTELNKFLRKKRKEFERQDAAWADMKQVEKIKGFLDGFILFNYDTLEYIELNPKQKFDTNLFIQKRYCYVQWEMGSGKSIAALAISEYRRKFGDIRNVFIVSTAICIENNWEVNLSHYRINYTRVRTITDIMNIKPGQYVLLTLEAVRSLQRHIQKFIKIHSQKFQLVLDEADNISNPDSVRTRAVLACFRRVKYKALLSGTMTRNNIVESYTQFELLYNNSANMMSEAETIYEKDKNGGLKETANEYYLRPFPTFKKGLSLFRKSFLPEKITVFGIVKDTQDIYNQEVLKKLIDKTIITRTFEEMSQKDIYDIKQKVVGFSPEEAALYKKVIEEFNTLRDRYFDSTGDARKDSMFKMLQQLLLLLKVCAAPNSLAEYNSPKMPTKIKEILNMIKKWPDEPVVIGVRHVEVVDIYERYLKFTFPDRNVYKVTGGAASLKKRRQVAAQMEGDKTGILICTQQSLSSSMNIGFINKIIIPELHYNNASMSQFYFRFIRYTSTEHKEVHYVTYGNSIEMNLMQMVIAKEKLNQYMKNEDLEFKDLYDKFGIDYDIMNMLLYKEKDQDGKVKIHWGEQQIV